MFVLLYDLHNDTYSMIAYGTKDEIDKDESVFLKLIYYQFISNV